MQIDTGSGKAPFLARFSTKRLEGAPLPGRYDETRSLWVVATAAGEVPLVDANHRLRELETKTKVNDEQDDSAQHVLNMVSATETSVSGEGDDNDLLSLLTATITEVKTEADDVA